MSLEREKDLIEYISRALGVALGVLEVPVARALVLVPISPRGHALALVTANSAVLQAPILHARIRAPLPALGVTEAFIFHIQKQIKIIN